MKMKNSSWYEVEAKLKIKINGFIFSCKDYFIYTLIKIENNESDIIKKIIYRLSEFFFKYLLLKDEII